MPSTICTASTTWHAPTSPQYHRPGSPWARRILPSTHPVAGQNHRRKKSATTPIPMYLWTSGIRRESCHAPRRRGTLPGGLEPLVAVRAHPTGLVLVEPLRKVEPLHGELQGRGRGARRLLLHPETLQQLGQSGEGAERFQEPRRRRR